MYRYDDFDAAFVAARVEQFRDQVARRLSGELTEEQFRPHRLMNGLYLQLHAYMLRVAIPYGVLNSRAVAQARRHRAQIRPRLRPFHHPPEPSVQLAQAEVETPRSFSPNWRSVEMHAIQTSGNCIRNVTADHLAGVAADEIADPRALTPRFCGNGRRSIPSSRSCRANSRSPINGGDAGSRGDPSP